MYIEKNFFDRNILLMNQNSTLDQKIRPEDLIQEFNIGKDTYYNDLKYLGIKAEKDSKGKPYLTFEQAEQVRALRSYVNRNGKREGFENSSLVHSSNNELATNGNEEDIYVKPEEPRVQFDFNQLMRGAQEIKLRELATPDLLMRGIADQLTEEDLSDDLKEKLAAVREAVNPKWTPASLATEIVAQYRSSRSGS